MMIVMFEGSEKKHGTNLVGHLKLGPPVAGWWKMWKNGLLTVSGRS